MLPSRLELSRAKHPSLIGHVRMARHVTRMLRGYHLTHASFFNADGAPPAVVARRQVGFEALARRFRERAPRSIAATIEAVTSLSDLQLIGRNRVPFPFSTHVREHLATGSFWEYAEGVQLQDLDGNRFYDLTGAYGVNVFGVDFYKECMAEGARIGSSVGPLLGGYQSCTLDNLARLRGISGMDEISFHMSGTEAVMQAVRLARYHTGRRYVVRFAGAYNGWWDDVQPGPGNPSPPGYCYTLRDMHENTLRVLRHRRDIACVVVNPLQALHPNRGAPGDSTLIDGSRSAGFDRQAYSRWLRQLREVCDQRGIAFILDEVFVGFRLAMRGAQEYFGVEADMVCYGKTLGGGFPIGVVCGRTRWMQRFKPDRPADICFARGTFNAHPYVMGAMHAFLHRLQTPEMCDLYACLDDRWRRRHADFNEAMHVAGVPVQARHMSSIWTIGYTQPSRYHWMLQFYLCDAGLALSWVGTGRLIFSLNYSDADFAEVTRRFAGAARRMREDGWWHSPSLTHARIRRHFLNELLSARFPVLARWWGRSSAP